MQLDGYEVDLLRQKWRDSFKVVANKHQIKCCHKDYVLWLFSLKYLFSLNLCIFLIIKIYKNYSVLLFFKKNHTIFLH